MIKNSIRLLLIVAAPLASSCVSELDKFSTREVRFGASSGYAGGMGTRTEYTGLDEQGSSISSESSAERIDWIATDVVRIISPESTTASSSSPRHYADYSVTPGEASGRKHNATLSPHGGNGLEWSDEPEHHFFAIYPSPLLNDQAGINLNGDGSAAAVSGYVPRDQDGTLSGYNYKPDMTYAYMYANSSTRRASEVSLTFYPLVTTFEFTLRAADAEMAAKTLTSVSLSSEEDGAALSGGFGAEVSPSGLGAVTAAGATGNTVSLDLSGLPGGGVRLNRTYPYTFTLFALPFAQTRLTLRLVYSDGTTRSLALKDAGEWITVPARSKVYFRNLGVPGTVGGYFFGDLIPLTLDHNGGSASLSDSFQSYKTIGGVSESVPFELQFSTDGGVSWTTTCPDWLTLDSGIDFGGSIEGHPLNVTVAPQVNTAVDLQREALAGATPKTEFDLSTLNVATGATVARSTANCYVVQAPGTYKFPVVYGNGIKDGTVNEDAYHCRDGINGAYRETPDSRYLAYFQDHLDNDITNPYIGLQHEGSTLTAELLWTDVEGLVDGVSISGSGEHAYISFNVPVETINEGNALIAVLVDGVVAWSWHIWVSAQDLTAWQSIGTYQFSPVNIGWCQAKEREKYEERSCLVRAVQSVSGAISNATTLGYAPIVETPETLYHEGNNTYYQWGRKDPQQAILMNSGVRKDYYPTDPAYAPVVIHPTGTTITYGYPKYGGAIQTPWATYVSATSSYHWVTRVDREPPAANRPLNISEVGRRTTMYYNAWSSTVPGSMSALPTSSTVARSPVTKTVYDPCPVGFSVPQFSAFSALSTTSFPKATVDGVEGRMYRNTFFLPFVPVFQISIQMPAWPRYWAATVYTYDKAYALVFNSSYANSSSNVSGYSYFSCPVRPLVNY